MKIVTYAEGARFELLARNLAETLRMHGHDLDIYGPGRSFDDWQPPGKGRTPYKPHIMRDALRTSQEVLWLDADILYRGGDISVPRGCDVAFTPRSLPEGMNRHGVTNNLVNNGVCWWTHGAMSLLNMYCEEVDKRNDLYKHDQHALNVILERELSDGSPMGVVQDVDEHGRTDRRWQHRVQIAFVSPLLFNYSYPPMWPEEDVGDARFLHFKSLFGKQWRFDAYTEWVDQFDLEAVDPL